MRSLYRDLAKRPLIEICTEIFPRGLLRRSCQQSFCRDLDERSCQETSHRDLVQRPGEENRDLAQRFLVESRASRDLRTYYLTKRSCTAASTENLPRRSCTRSCSGIFTQQNLTWHLFFMFLAGGSCRGNPHLPGEGC